MKICHSLRVEYLPMPDFKNDEYWMTYALKLANSACIIDEVPVGCVVVQNGKILGEGYNLRESTCDPTAHAELIAIQQAAKALGAWRLLDTTLYVTLEPCFMCAGAIVNSRIPRVVFGATDPKTGAVVSLAQVLNDVRLNHRCTVLPGILQHECQTILKQFFKTKRAHRDRGIGQQ